MMNDHLENVSIFKYLDLWFDPLLKWDTHIEKIAGKLSQKIGILERLSHYVGQ